MEVSKTQRIVILTIAVFVISLIYALIDAYPYIHSPYNLGFITGKMFIHLIKVAGVLALIFLVIRTAKK